MQQIEAQRKSDEEMDAWFASQGRPLPELPPNSFHLPPFAAGVDLPITVGKRR